MAGSAPQDAIAQRHLGLPPRLLSTSLLTWDGIAEVVEALRLSAGARLIGVDFSAEAIRQATENTARAGRPAQFRVGDLSDTGLPDASVDAGMCVDAIQFADPPAAAYAELRRVLRAVDTGAGLLDAGFVEVEVLDRPAWRSAERSMWQEAAALDPGEDPAWQAFHKEGVRVLGHFGSSRRVMACGTAP